MIEWLIIVKFCLIEVDECKIISNGMETNPCKNNGTCYDLIDAYYCEYVFVYSI